MSVEQNEHARLEERVGEMDGDKMRLPRRLGLASACAMAVEASVIVTCILVYYKLMGC